MSKTETKPEKPSLVQFHFDGYRHAMECTGCTSKVFALTAESWYQCVRCAKMYALGGTPTAYLTPTEHLLTEHPRWAKMLARAGIRAIFHWRQPSPTSPYDQDGMPLHYSHIAVVVLANGYCYYARATFPSQPYNRRLQRLRCVGRALKRCALDEASFAVDGELEMPDLYRAVRASVSKERS